MSRSPGRYLRDADAHPYGAPVNRFVAGFIGTPAMNFLEGRREEEDGVPVFIAEGARVKLLRKNIAASMSSEPITLGIRPEDLRVQSGATPGDGLAGRVVLVERLGGTSHIHFDVGPHRMMASVVNESLPDVGDNISIHVPAERVHLFGEDDRTLT